MPQLLALEWDDSEARLVVAATRGERVVIERAFSVALRSGQAGEDVREVDVGGQIAAALAGRGIRPIDTLVAVGRSSIELRRLSLPPAPENDLPDMVCFQAVREFNEFDESWLLDFVPIDRPPQGPQNVLAAAIGPELVGQIQQTCETAGLKPRRLILRPCAAASLLGRTGKAGTSRPRLLVDLLSDEADLTVMIDPRVIFLRTTRLSGDPLQDPGHARALLAEIRRTVGAAQNQLGGELVESIVLCGSGEQHAALARSIENTLERQTELFDPFSGLNLGRELQRTLPDHPGRFAPLLGMALAELEQTGHAIDFLHPRRRAKPPSRRTKLIPLAVAAILLLASFFAYGRMQRYWLTNEINALSAEAKSLDKEIARKDKTQREAKEIEKWMATDVLWLDELRKLSADFPPAKKAMLTQLVLIARTRDGEPGGVMELDGLAETGSAIGPMEEGLRNEARDVEGMGSSELAPAAKYYSWQFRSSLFVSREEESRESGVQSPEPSTLDSGL